EVVGTYTYDQAGAPVKIQWKKGSTVIATDEVARSQSGRVVNQLIDGVDARPSNPNFVYDAAGRLIDAWVPGYRAQYLFDTTPCASTPSAGKNSNPTGTHIYWGGGGGLPLGLWYAMAARFTYIGHPDVGTVAYDTRGNTTVLGGVSFSYVGGNRHMSTVD